jgi:S-(hydroxymethyl)glutathione synthase
MSISIHPGLDGGVKQGSSSFAGGMLCCECSDRPVKVKISSQVLHNHACGCTKCWKPDGATFSVVAVVASDKVAVVENGDKLKVVDSTALIQRHACQACGVHLHGPVEREGHPFYGLTFIHPELFEEDGADAPTFAAFVSSIIEAGMQPSKMDAVRARLVELGLPPYDCLNPALMDYLATAAARASGTLRE